MSISCHNALPSWATIRRELILPFAVSDQASAIASLQLDDLLEALLSDVN